MHHPRILAAREVYVNEWVSLVEKDVEIQPGSVQQYYTLVVPDYVAVFAETTTGKVPVIRQYRPAIESYTWELPAGTLEKGEDPLQCCVRELKEETGLDALSVEYLGASASDAGRLMNRQHIFRVKASEPSAKFTPEPGTEVRCVSHDELRQLIYSGAFPHQLHLAALFRCGFTL